MTWGGPGRESSEARAGGGFWGLKVGWGLQQAPQYRMTGDCVSGACFTLTGIPPNSNVKTYSPMWWELKVEPLWGVCLRTYININTYFELQP